MQFYEDVFFTANSKIHGVATIPATNNTDGYEIDNTPALIVGLTVALVLILSITAPLTVTVLVRVCRGGYSARVARGRALESAKVQRMLQEKQYNAVIEIRFSNSPVQTLLRSSSISAVCGDIMELPELRRWSNTR